MAEDASAGFNPMSAITSIGSSLLNFFGTQQQNDKNREFQNQINSDNYQHSKEFAQNSVSWRVQDALAAGVHPLYALGAPTMSFAPAQAGAPQPSPLAAASSGLRDLGQDVSRAAMAASPAPTRMAGIQSAQQIASNALDLQEKQLRIDLLKARIATATQPGAPPPAPGVGFNSPTGKIDDNPPLSAGIRWLTVPSISPAKAWEDRYGDDGPVSWAVGTGIAGADAAYNAYEYSKYLLGSGRAAVDRWLANERSKQVYGAGRTPY